MLETLPLIPVCFNHPCGAKNKGLSNGSTEQHASPIISKVDWHGDGDSLEDQEIIFWPFSSV